MLALITLIPLLPLVGFTVNILFGKRLRGASAYVAVTTVVTSFILSAWLFLRIQADPTPITVRLFTWMAAGTLSIDMGFLVDRLSSVMLLVVTGVGALIHIYSIGYMHGDPRYGRFFAYMNLFAAMMLLLVLGDNYLVLFLGWEGVGLCSYLLIGFWFERPFDGRTTNDAARKAFIVNRIGDVGFILGVFLIWTTVGGLSFAQAQAAAQSGTIAPAIATAVTLLLFVGATGKSAQIPLHVWLPDAMAGPTPVSALIHAATMVTAGVYMVARNHFLFDLAPFSQNVVVWIGALTALFAASMGVQQNDIKKILAYSTISQLGHMFMGVGAGAYAAGIMHLTTHAYFKALLFLGAGMVIHALHGEQDITRMGGLKQKLPGVYWVFLMGALALVGIPFTAGFFSKDSILAGVYGHGHFIPWAIGVITAGITAFYTFRLVFLAFHGPYRAHAEHPHQPARSMFIPCAVLAALSIIGGYVELPMHLFAGFSHFLMPVVGATEVHLSVGTELLLMGGTLVLILAGIWGAWSLFGREMTPERAQGISAEPAGLMRVLRHKWYVDELYDLAIIKPLTLVSRTVLWRAVDDWVIHGFVVQFCGGLMWKAIGFTISFWHTGRVGSYAFGIVLGALLVLWVLIGA